MRQKTAVPGTTEDVDVAASEPPIDAFETLKSSIEEWAKPILNTSYKAELVLHMENAILSSQKMLGIGEELDQLLLTVTALCDLASMMKVRGRLRQAQAYYDRAREWLVNKDGLDSRVRCAYEVGWADSLLQWNKLEAAYEHALIGVEYGQRYEAPSERTWGYVTLMRVLQAQGDVEGALDVLYEAEQVLQAQHVRQALRVELETKRVALWLAIGDPATASYWAERCDGGSEREQLVLARLRLAQGRHSEAQQLLEQQRTLAEDGGRAGRLIEILGLLALAHDAQGRQDDAALALSHALGLARPEGYVRVFLDMGERLRDLLKLMLSQAPIGSAAVQEMARIDESYVRELLNAFRAGSDAEQRQVTEDVFPTLSRVGASIDRLTERELDVLRLLAQGLSNKEIAVKLVVAPSTVKQHLKNIYSKIDVHSRTQAVARARELDLL